MIREFFFLFYYNFLFTSILFIPATFSYYVFILRGKNEIRKLMKIMQRIQKRKKCIMLLKLHEINT